MSAELSIKQMVDKLKASGYSQAKLARICGVSDAGLSNYLRGQYGVKDFTTIEEKIISGLEVEIKRQSVASSGQLTFLKTSTANTIGNIALICHTQQKMGLVYGDAGYGKTRSCKEYATRYKNVIYLEVRPSYTAKTLMRALAIELGCLLKSNQYEQEELIISKLMGAGKLVIVDQIEYLNDRAIDTLRTVVYDAAKTGLLLVGLETAKYVIIGKKYKNEYLSSRCLANRKIGPITLDDVKMSVRSVWPEATDKICGRFYIVANGSMRLLENTIFESQRLLSIPENTKHGLSTDLVDNAAKTAILE